MGCKWVVNIHLDPFFFIKEPRMMFAGGLSERNAQIIDVVQLARVPLSRRKHDGHSFLALRIGGRAWILGLLGVEKARLQVDRLEFPGNVSEIAGG